MPKPPLTAREEAFCQKFLELGNKSEAYRQAGYSVARMAPATCNVRATELSQRPRVAARIAELQAAACTRHELTLDRVIEEYEAVGFSRYDEVIEFAAGVRKLRPYAEIPDPARRAIQSVTSKQVGTRKTRMPDGSVVSEPIFEDVVKLHDKAPALTALAKRVGLHIEAGEAVADGLEALLRRIDGQDRGLPQ